MIRFFLYLEMIFFLPMCIERIKEVIDWCILKKIDDQIESIKNLEIKLNLLK